MKAPEGWIVVEFVDDMWLDDGAEEDFEIFWTEELMVWRAIERDSLNVIALCAPW